MRDFFAASLNQSVLKVASTPFLAVRMLRDDTAFSGDFFCTQCLLKSTSTEFASER